jgi:hypothetical protein
VDLIVIEGNTQPFTAGKGRSVLLRRCGSHTSVRCAPPNAIQPHQGASQFQPQLFPARSIGFWHSFVPNHGDRTKAFGKRGTHHARHGRTPQTPPSAKLLCLSLKTGQVVSGKKWRGFIDFAHELWHTAHVQKPCPRGKKKKWKGFHA